MVIQIAAQGRQNEFLNGSPDMTLFKTTHVRYTNFAEDYEENDFSAGTVGFGQKVSTSISRYGDLVSDLLLEVQLPALSNPSSVTDASGNAVDDEDVGVYWVNAIGFAIMSEVQLEIGGTEVDTLYPEWMYFWEELTQRPGARLHEQIGKFAWSDSVEDDMIEFAAQARYLYVPLPFWFNKYFMEKGLCIPLIALTYHDIKVKVTFASLASCAVTVYKQTDATFGDYLALSSLTPLNVATGSTLAAADLDARLLVCYVYLDNDERNAFASVEHEYLITCTQRQTASITTAGSASDQLKLYFNHPCNCLTWMIQPTAWMTARRRFSVGHQDRFDFSLYSASTTASVWGDVTDSVKSASLTLNGHSRWPDALPGMFFRVVQPSLKWTNIPTGYMYTFNFSAEGGSWNPTSTLNFSRIDHVQLELKYNASIPTSTIFVFVENYNILLVKDGMGGVRWSN